MLLIIDEREYLLPGSEIINDPGIETIRPNRELIEHSLLPGFMAR